MGNHLSSPATNKSTQTGADARFAYGVASMQGWRITMEDAHTAILALDTAQTRKYMEEYVVDFRKREEVRAAQEAARKAEQEKWRQDEERRRLEEISKREKAKNEDDWTPVVDLSAVADSIAQADALSPSADAASAVSPLVATAASSTALAVQETAPAAPPGLPAPTSLSFFTTSPLISVAPTLIDAVNVPPLPHPTSFFAVYDGHKNGDASAFAGRHLHHRLVLEATPRLHEKTANVVPVKDNQDPAQTTRECTETSSAPSQVQDPWADALRAAFLGTDEDMLAESMFWFGKTQGERIDESRAAARAELHRAVRLQMRSGDDDSDAVMSGAQPMAQMVATRRTDNLTTATDAPTASASPRQSHLRIFAPLRSRVSTTGAAAVSSEADPDLKRSEGGCTAVSALITPEGILYVANAGDSRAVLCSAGKAKDLSTDHKPVNPGESERISASGGWIQNQRLNGDLALSRALGDFRYKNKKDLPPEKQPLTAYPDVTEHRLTEDDEFMIIACDGIWDVLSSQSAVDYVRLEIARGRVSDFARGLTLDDTPVSTQPAATNVSEELLGQISEAVCEYCLSPELGNGGIGMDNMTILIIAILGTTTTSAGTTRARTFAEWQAWVKARVEAGWACAHQQQRDGDAAAQGQAPYVTPKEHFLVYSVPQRNRFLWRRRAIFERQKEQKERSAQQLQATGTPSESSSQFQNATGEAEAAAIAPSSTPESMSSSSSISLHPLDTPLDNIASSSPVSADSSPEDVSTPPADAAAKTDATLPTSTADSAETKPAAVIVTSVAAPSQ